MGCCWSSWPRPGWSASSPGATARSRPSTRSAAFTARPSGRMATGARAEFLTRFLGFREVGRGGESAAVSSRPPRARGPWWTSGGRRGSGPAPDGVGTVHHVAFRAPSDDGPARAARADRGGGRRHHAGGGPAVLPLGLLPRAGRRAVRDRHRSAGLHRRRAAAELGTQLRLPPRYEAVRAADRAHAPARPAAARVACGTCRRRHDRGAATGLRPPIRAGDAPGAASAAAAARHRRQRGRSPAARRAAAARAPRC